MFKEPCGWYPPDTGGGGGARESGCQTGGLWGWVESKVEVFRLVESLMFKVEREVSFAMDTRHRGGLWGKGEWMPDWRLEGLGVGLK